MLARRWGCALVPAWLGLSGCGAYFHVTANGVSPRTQPEYMTETAFLWGAIQPNDVVPNNCAAKVPLAEVTSQQSFGAFALEFVTLGIVNIHTLEWRCAGLPGGQDTHVLGN